MDFSNTQGIKGVLDSLKDKTFMESPLHVQAKKDFNTLCQKIGYSGFNNLNYMSVKYENTYYVGEFLVLGHNLTDKQVTFPKYLFDANNDKLYLAVVVYSNGTPTDAFAFKATEFKKTGLLSMYKYDKNTDAYSVGINPNKLKQYSFGYVLKNIKLGEKNK